MTLAKPTAQPPKEPKRLDRRPKCANCGYGPGRHGGFLGQRCPVEGSQHEFSNVLSYVPRPSLSRSSPVRTEAKKKPRKIMPRCRLCAHTFRKHCVFPKTGTLSAGCFGCEACTGYEPSRGARQKRRTPLAAIKRTADALWSKLVKHGKGCEIQQYHPHECKGPLEAMHGVPRTFAATRWNLLDGFCGCSAAHLYFTRRPELWSAILLDAWGYETFREMWRIARASQPVDMEAVVASLRSELAAREISE